MKLSVDADLKFSVDVPGARRVNGHLTGSGTDLELRVDDSFVFAGRRDAGAIRGFADGLAERGLTITVVDPSGPLVTLGARRTSWLQRRVTRSPHIRIERGAGLWTLARGRAQATNAGALPPAEIAPPATMWPLAPTFMRRPRRVTTTHDPGRGGNPRLVMALQQVRPADDLPHAFRLTRDATTIGSAPDSDIHLPGIAPRHAVVQHDEQDEFVLVSLAPHGMTKVHGSAVDQALLRDATRIELGDWTLSFAREEYADHGRPYGGRVGGEIGHQRPQPPRG